MRWFFVTGLGRSGTAFLANLLGRDPAARVVHEPYHDDYLHLPIAYYGNATTCIRDYVHRRRRTIEATLGGSAGTYGEVNSLLRYFTDEIREVFDDPPMLFIVRSARAYVQSAYVRDVYTEDATHTHIVPKDDDPWAGEWARFDRFEKLCWYWSHTNEHLLGKLARFVRLEDLLADYGALRDGVLAPTGVQVGEAVYREEVGTARNTTAQFMRHRAGGLLRRWLRRRPAPARREFGAWTEARERALDAICGPTLKRLGYA